MVTVQQKVSYVFAFSRYESVKTAQCAVSRKLGIRRPDTRYRLVTRAVFVEAKVQGDCASLQRMCNGFSKTSLAAPEHQLKESAGNCKDGLTVIIVVSTLTSGDNL
ncbi:hypothetical protein AVEN_106450-1 [Araneus ventricosus]|uniref:Uncharacterized protein n=1 Tax=Araneus ventricosus TaxID=182803 RepID=A0A4Y2ASJ3_ARAVE|nr:hypothetical protein AVEN_106450-1 [Araneus ventricosus]